MTEDADRAPRRTITHRPGDPWRAETGMVVDEVAAIELRPAGGYGWSTLTSSDSAVAEVSGAVDDSGHARFTVKALAPGVVALSATTEHRGDRFGPPAHRWILRLRVVDRAK